VKHVANQISSENLCNLTSSMDQTVWPLKLVYSSENVESCRISLRALQHSLNKHNT